MKKWMLFLATVALIGGALATGCQKDDSSKTDKDAAQNASDPAKMKAMPAPAGGKKGLQPPGV